MSLKLGAGLAMVLFTTCGDDAPSSSPSAPATWVCDDVYDTGCRYRAEVSIDGGRLAEAAMIDTPSGWGTIGSFRDLRGQVTVVDSVDGEQVQCGFTARLDIGTEMIGSDAVVTSDPTVVFDDGCPIACPWFFPAGGTFDDAAGRYTLQPSEGVWSLQLGSWAPEEPYSQEWLVTATSSSSYGANAELLEPVAVLGASWTAPIDAPPAATIDAFCR